VALEPQLARRAAQRCSADGVAGLRATDARLDAAIGKGDVTGYLVENHQFHTELNEIAGAPILTDLVEGLWLRFGPSLRVVCGQFGTRNLPDLHKAILDALEAGDAEAAAEAMEQDVRQGMEQITAALEG